MTETQSGVLGEIGHSRSAEQVEHMQKSIGQGICPFCIIDRSKNPIDLHTNRSWRCMENAWPYPGHAVHLVIPSIQHWDSLQSITDDGILDLRNAVIEMMTEHTKIIPGGAFVLRFGNHANNAGTLRHLHAQIQVPSLLCPSFITFGNPNADQKEELLKLISHHTEQTTDFDEVGQTELWNIGTASTPAHVHQHFIFHNRQHTTGYKRGSVFREMGSDNWVDLFNAIKDTEKKHKIPGGSILMRFGDPDYGGRPYYMGMVAELIVADGTGPVIEVLHPAQNEHQALRAIKSFKAFS